MWPQGYPLSGSIDAARYCQVTWRRAAVNDCRLCIGYRRSPTAVALLVCAIKLAFTTTADAGPDVGYVRYS